MRHNHPHGPVSTIHSHQHHIGWDNSNPPVMKAAPGDVLAFDCLDPSCGQITPDWKAADLARLDFGKINPTLGPIEIDGAEPGDALRITFLGFENCG
jgi:acetamidase/formamidase